jgi:hypothetical protein
MKKSEEERDLIGSDLDQTIAMLERTEIDYEEDSEDEGYTAININESVRMLFDEDGILLEVNPILN